MNYYVGARLFPNVKGCGYPPMLNCTIWLKRYTKIGMKFPCYYSRVDPSLVISDLDYWQNTLNLVYSMAIPIPSFIISVIYLTYAYFKIYNEDEETAPLDKNAEDMDIDDIDAVDDSDGAVLADNVAGSHQPVRLPLPGALRHRARLHYDLHAVRGGAGPVRDLRHRDLLRGQELLVGVLP